MIVSVFRVIDGWHLLNTIIGLTIVYIATVLPFTIWTLRGFVNGVPGRARGGRDDRRMLQVRRLLAGHLPAARARSRRDRRLRVHPGVERVHHGARAERPSRDDDAAGVAAHVPRGERHARTGRPSWRGRRSWPSRSIVFFLIVQGADDERSGRAGPSRDDRAPRHRCGNRPAPGHPHDTAPGVRRHRGARLGAGERLGEGLGGVCLFGQNIVDAAQLRELNATLREPRTRSP